METDLPLELKSCDQRWCYPVPSTVTSVPEGVDDVQGRGCIHFAHGWTIISWWDRSEDLRRGSNAVFFVRGYCQWAEALARAAEAFPREITRMRASYGLGLWSADLPLLDPVRATALLGEVAGEEVRLRALRPEVLAALLERVRSASWR